MDEGRVARAPGCAERTEMRRAHRRSSAAGGALTPAALTDESETSSCPYCQFYRRQTHWERTEPNRNMAVTVWGEAFEVFYWEKCPNCRRSSKYGLPGDADIRLCFSLTPLLNFTFEGKRRVLLRRSPTNASSGKVSFFLFLKDNLFPFPVLCWKC